MNESTIATACNSGLAISGVSCFADCFAVSQNFMLRINFCGKMPAHRQAAERYAQCCEDRATDELCRLTLNFCVKLDNQKE